MTRDRFDALVIGGGPAGTACAIRLAQAGWSVALIEKSPFPRRKVCGEFVGAPTLPLLHALGVSDSFLELAGPPVQEVAIFAGDLVLRAPMPAAGPPSPWGRALCRERLDALLLDRATAAGVTVWQPWQAGPAAMGDGTMSCKVISGHNGATRLLTAPVVIDAGGSWGGRSITTGRRSATARNRDLLAFKARFIGTRLAEGLMPLLTFPGGYGGLVHSDTNRVSLSCCIRRDHLAECRRRFPRSRAGDAVLAHVLASCTGARKALAGAMTIEGWLGAGPLRPGIRDAYAGGIFRVGNAAGEAHPVVAEGISMAIQGGWLLGGLLARHPDASRGTSLSAIGETYRRSWREAFAGRIRFAALCAGLSIRPGMASGIVRLLQARPALLTHAARFSGKATLPRGPEAGSAGA